MRRLCRCPTAHTFMQRHAERHHRRSIVWASCKPGVISALTRNAAPSAAPLTQFTCWREAAPIARAIARTKILTQTRRAATTIVDSQPGRKRGARALSTSHGSLRCGGHRRRAQHRRKRQLRQASTRTRAPHAKPHHASDGDAPHAKRQCEPQHALTVAIPPNPGQPSLWGSRFASLRF